MPRAWLLPAAMAAVAFFSLACGSNPGDSDVGIRRGADDVSEYSLRADDPRFVAATKEARANLRLFLEALTGNSRADGLFSFMVRSVEGNDFEYLWVDDVRYERGFLRGTLRDEPRFTTRVKAGDQFEASLDEVLDWTFVRDGKLVGAYTLRALRDKLNAGERARFDREMVFPLE